MGRQAEYDEQKRKNEEMKRKGRGGGIKGASRGRG